MGEGGRYSQEKNKKDPLRRCATPPPEARGRKEDPTIHDQALAEDGKSTAPAPLYSVKRRHAGGKAHQHGTQKELDASVGGA